MKNKINKHTTIRKIDQGDRNAALSIARETLGQSLTFSTLVKVLVRLVANEQIELKAEDLK